LTSALSTLERHKSFRESSDVVFSDAVSTGVVWKGGLDDDIWEVNLAGMPIGVGSAGIRYALHRCVEEIVEKGGAVERDIVFITGVGRGGRVEGERGGMGERLTLKDFTIVYLRDEYGIRTTGREREGGVVVVERGIMGEWFRKYGVEE